MRLIKDNSGGVKAPATEAAPKGEAPEVEATCTRCLSTFAFRQTDAEVETTNELEFLLNCPACEQPLLIEKNTGIVRQR